MSWQVWLITFASPLLLDALAGLVKKWPPYLIAPFLRLWKESALLHEIIHDRQFSKWKPEAARYVALRAIKVRGEKQVLPEPALNLLERCLQRREPVVLLGEPGAGKTTALEALTYRLAKRALVRDRLIWLTLLIGTAVLAFTAPIFTLIWLSSFILWEPLVRRTVVPIFIEARSGYPGNEIKEWCEKLCQERLGDKPLLGSRHVALLIDGVNETPADLYDRFIEGWRGRLRHQPTSRIIFTSRGGEENPSERLGIDNALTVQDLDDAGVLEFLKVYGREKAVEQNRPYDAPQAQRDFDELQKKGLLGEGSIGRNPYWLKMIVESGLYTVNRGALFRSFAERLIIRETKEKPEEPKRKPKWEPVLDKVAMDALAALALAMHREKRIGFTDESGWRKARAVIRENIEDLPYTPDDLLGEAEAATLLRQKYKQRVEFVHQLVQEFFAAYALRREPQWQEALDRAEDVWWWQTLFLLGGLIAAESSAESYSRFVRLVLGDATSEPRIFAAIGLLRSAEHAPAELTGGVIDAFGRLMEKGLTLREYASTLNMTEAQQLALKEMTRALGDEAVEAFGLLLLHTRVALQVVGVLILSFIGGKRAAELIIEHLSEPVYRVTGVAPLVAIGAPAIEPLTVALRRRNEFSHVLSDALEGIGEPALQALLSLLADEEGHWPAIWALHNIGEPAVTALIAALRHPNPTVRENAVEALAWMNNPRAVEGLILALHDESAAICQTAAEQLGRRQVLQAIEPLIAALGDQRFLVRNSAAAALAGIGTPAVARLLQTLEDENVRVRGGAAIALGRIGDVRAVEPLILALRDARRSMRSEAARALGRIGDARATEALLAMLSDRNAFLRSSAATALGRIGDPRAVEPLIAALHDKDDYLRRCAAAALGKIGDARALEPLLAAMYDPGFLVQGDVIAALGEIGDRRAVEPLAVALQDQDAMTRWYSAEALARLGDTRSIPFLTMKLQGADETYHQFAVKALAGTGSPLAIAPLRAALSHAKEIVRLEAVNGLAGIGGPEAMRALAAALKDPSYTVRREVVKAIGRFDAAEAIEWLIEALQDADGDVRKAAAAGLQRIGAPAVDGLVAALRKVEGRVYTSLEAGAYRLAAYTLAEIGAPSVLPLVRLLDELDKKRAAEAGTTPTAPGPPQDVESFIAAMDEEYVEPLENAFSALFAMRDTEAVEPLLTALRHENGLVRQWAAYALGRIGDPRALPDLERLARDDKSETATGTVAFAARHAVEEILGRQKKEPGAPEAISA